MNTTIPGTVLTPVSVTFWVAGSEDEDGEPTSWVQSNTEPAQLVSETPDRLTFRQPNEQGGTFDWDAYRWDFGPDWGEQWAYGTSAELLTFNRLSMCWPSTSPRRRC